VVLRSAIEITEGPGRRCPSPRDQLGQGFDVAAGRRFSGSTPRSGRALHLGRHGRLAKHLLVRNTAKQAARHNLFSTARPWAWAPWELLLSPGRDMPCPAAGLSRSGKPMRRLFRPSDFPPF